MTQSAYRIDPITDLPHAREFMATPVGLHSPGLQSVSSMSFVVSRLRASTS
jgi:hypothetical protein